MIARYTDGLPPRPTVPPLPWKKVSSTEFFVAAGPYPEGFETKKVEWDNWLAEVKADSESD